MLRKTILYFILKAQAKEKKSIYQMKKVFSWMHFTFKDDILVMNFIKQRAFQ